VIARKLVAEFVGTAFLLMGVVGSGIAAEKLSPGDTGLQLLENALVTAGVLLIIIWVFAAVSGSHFNPAVTLASVAIDGMAVKLAAAYVVAQVLGGVFGAVLANVMFDLAAVEWSTTERSGSNLWLSEVIATFGLLLVIFALVRAGRQILIAPAVAAYIGAAYFFTSSTSFANPAVTIARMFTDTFAGIEPASAPAFIVAQLVGTVIVVGFIVWMWPSATAEKDL
jgi:glycerol uptake facilitator-like aquaporin